MDDINVVVMDNGSGSMKIEFGGEDAPRHEFPTTTSRVRHPLFIDTFVGKFIGADIRRPIEHGIITNWDDMEKIWHHSFYNLLAIAPEEHPVLLTEPPLNPRANLEKMVQIMFETFNVPAFKATISSVLALYSTGRVSGVVVDSGESVCHTVPIYDGYALPHAIRRSNIAGRDATAFLATKMGQPSSQEMMLIARQAKEEIGYVARDFISEIQHDDQSIPYTLPDGTMLSLPCSSRSMCLETLFRPALIASSDPGVSDMLSDRLSQCDVDIRARFASSVVLSGGSTMAAGFEDRVRRDLEMNLPQLPVDVVETSNRKYMAWLGGSILASLPLYGETCISKEEYDESGPSVVRPRRVF